MDITLSVNGIATKVDRNSTPPSPAETVSSEESDDVSTSVTGPDSVQSETPLEQVATTEPKKDLLQVPQPLQPPPRSRRCQTQRHFPKYPPGEVARHHSPMAPRHCAGTAAAGTTVTPSSVGRQMSQQDPHYVPGSPGTNPFSNLPPHLTEARKIFTSKDLFSSCFELLNLQGTDWHSTASSAARPYRKAISMIHPPDTMTKNFQ